MEFKKIPVSEIKTAAQQSRQNFDQQKLEELAKSIKEVGQLHPVIVKKQGDDYLLIAGERRLRAIKNEENDKSEKEEETIAAMIVEDDLSEQSLRQIQLVENLQREDLDPLERARSIQKFIDKHDLAKKEASQKLGVPRTTLTEWLNILEVDKFYQEAVLNSDSSLTISHISLSKGLASKTGDPTKKKQLLDAVLKYNLTRSETKEVIDLFYKYLHLSMSEALGAILLKRERVEYQEENQDDNNSSNSVSNMIRLLGKLGENLENLMEERGELTQEEREKVIDEFAYVYQLIEIMVPEVKDKSMPELLQELKTESVKAGR